MNFIKLPQNVFFFLLAICLSGLWVDRASAQNGCLDCTPYPTNESTNFAGHPVDEPKLTKFRMAVSDYGQTVFDGRLVWETSPYKGYFSCHTPTNGIPEYVGVEDSANNTQGNWPIGKVYRSQDANDTSFFTLSNNWGMDVVGLNMAGINLIRNTAQLPCSVAIPQDMNIDCPVYPGTSLVYTSDTLTITVYADRVENCRAGICDTVY